MERHFLQLLKPLKVIPFGPTKARVNELPKGAEVQVLRESSTGDCVDISYQNERFFALKSKLFCTPSPGSEPVSRL